jgi:hypothetical protein
VRFKVVEVELRMCITPDRSDCRMEVLDPGKKRLAQAAIAACGRTNLNPPNPVDPAFGFAGLLKSQTELNDLKASLKAFLADLDTIEIG